MASYPFILNQPKALAKCVDIKRLCGWVADPRRRRIDLTEAWERIKNHYCAALVGRGVCPIECENCREAIVSMFDDFDDAREPLALLTWRAKDRSARMIERLIEEQKHDTTFPTLETERREQSAALERANPITALFPEKRNDNLFLDLLEDYR